MDKAKTTRVDTALVKMGLAESREKAKAFVMAGRVFVNSQVVLKSSLKIKEEDRIELKGDISYVSRGYLKLGKALDDFGIDVRGKTCVDIGSSTGGFVQCLIERGALKVFAVDVGKGLLHEKLRSNPRVIPLEGKNARYLKLEDIGEIVDLATVDVSFISCLKVLPPLKDIVRDWILVLIKPNFELPKGYVKGGVVKDSYLHIMALEGVATGVSELGLFPAGLTFSEPPGASGNLEFFMLIRKDMGTPLQIEEIVKEAWSKCSSKS